MNSAALARYAAALVPRGLVRRAALLSSGARSVTVVVTVATGDATALERTLESLSRQSLRAAEVLLLATGPEALTVARRQAPDVGNRARVLRIETSTPADTAAAAVRRARGRLMLLLAAGGRLREHALSDLVETMAEHHADLAGAGIRDLAGVATADLLARRNTWGAAAAHHVEGPHADWSLAAWAVLSAQRPVLAPSPREASPTSGGISFGTMPVLAPWVARWWDETRRLLDEVDRRDAAAAGVFRRQLLERQLHEQLGDAERSTDAEWAVLVEAARSLETDLTSHELAEVGVEARVCAWLAARGHRHVLATFNSQRWLGDGQFRTRVRDGAVQAELPLPDGLVPEDVLVLGTLESALVAELRGLRWVSDEILEVHVHAYVRGVASHPDDTSLEFTLVAADGRTSTPVVSQHSDPLVNVAAGERWVDHSWGAFTLRLEAGDLLRQARAGDVWQLSVRLDSGGLTRCGELTGVDRQGGATVLATHRPTGLTVRPRREGAISRLEVVRPSGSPPSVTGWSVVDVRLEGEEVVVVGVVGTRGGAVTVELMGPQCQVEAEALVAGDRFEARLTRRHERWGLETLPLPSAQYDVRIRHDGVPVGRLPVGTELQGRLPLLQRDGLHRLRVHRGAEGACLLSLTAPLADDEIGAFAQQQLRHWYGAGHRIDPTAVYLQSYAGLWATDSPLAIHHALRRLRPDLTTYWAVADLSTPVPPGAQPVLVRSREWYAALATCGHLVTNVDMETWFVKRPGQRLLQTYHGYPSKTMGIAAWQAKNFTPLRIERQLRRTSGTWDLLLTPTPEMDEHYRRQYRYDGPILAAGYPRDDMLLAADAEQTRRAVRERLGIAPGQRAVLYAPTWRDDQATNFRSAQMSTTLDAGAVAHALGEKYVVLLRGHRFHRRREAASAGVVDVSSYPEVNHLLLASDAAVLDYSSMRFDLALLRRPMVFLVPDLDRYEAGVRGFLYDFRTSAPGPLVATAEEVIAELRDFDRLAARHVDELDRFNAVFNAYQDGQAADRTVRTFFGGAPGSGANGHGCTV